MLPGVSLYAYVYVPIDVIVPDRGVRSQARVTLTDEEVS
jgi:hypothetical protein